jgi:hypothetical protein
MFRHLFGSGCLSLFVAALAGLILPNSASAIGLKIDEISAVPYSEARLLHNADGRPTGVIEQYTAPPGSALWMITYRATPQWDEATEDFNFDYETYGFYNGDKKLTTIGDMLSFGILSNYVSPPGMYRPEDWKEAKPSSMWRRCWIIAPKDLPEVTLRLTHVQYNEDDRSAEPKKTPYTATVKLAGTPVPFKMDDYVEVRVRGVKMLDSLEIKEEYNDRVPPRTLVNEGGSIMQLTLQLTPKKKNRLVEADDERGLVFDWEPAWLGLSFGRGGRAICMGAKDGNSISDYGAEIESADGEIWDSKTVALYFPVPSNLRSFQVTFLGQVLAEGAVE